MWHWSNHEIDNRQWRNGHGDISFYYFSLEKIPYRLNFSIKVAEKNRLDLATYGGQVGSVLMTTFDTNLLFFISF
jgi:hypothetical protein